jgi:hypothetical protein
LYETAKALAINKCSGTDGVLVEFFTKSAVNPLVGGEYSSMVQQSIMRGSFPSGINKGLIALLHKGGAKDEIGNYRPITIFNVTYKIMAKALQRHLQPLLSEVISTEQIAFLPIGFILDNVLTIHESIA